MKFCFHAQNLELENSRGKLNSNFWLNEIIFYDYLLDILDEFCYYSKNDYNIEQPTDKLSWLAAELNLICNSTRTMWKCSMWIRTELDWRMPNLVCLELLDSYHLNLLHVAFLIKSKTLFFSYELETEVWALISLYFKYFFSIYSASRELSIQRIANCRLWPRAFDKL